MIFMMVQYLSNPILAEEVHLRLDILSLNFKSSILDWPKKIRDIKGLTNLKDLEFKYIFLYIQ